MAAFLTSDEPEWKDDTLVFITARVVLALRRLPDDPKVQDVIDRANGFLKAQREPGGLWRYWSRDHERHGFTPPDADDTACASLALSDQGTVERTNTRILLANRDARGRFYTWLVPHRPRPGGLLGWWDLRSERFSRSRRAELWTSTEADHDDVDGVVNANVIAYLGPRSPSQAVEWVADLIESDREEGCDSWYHSPFALYASVADGHRRGVGRFSALGDLIASKIRARLEPDGRPPTALDAGQALSALSAFNRRDERGSLAEWLVETQRDDGSWPRSVCYHGGPSESFGWASDALTAATAAAALARVDEQ